MLHFCYIHSSSIISAKMEFSIKSVIYNFIG